MGIETTDTIQATIAPVIAAHGFELVEVKLTGGRKGGALRIVIHKDGGITLDDCSLISREVGYLLEVDDLISHSYTLEVSSPGMDRPLKTARDFERVAGNKITVLYDDAGVDTTVTGTMERVIDGKVVVKTEKQESIIPLDAVFKAKQEIEF